MSINIKNREVVRLLAELRRATGKGASQVVLDLLRKESARFRRHCKRDERRRRVLAGCRAYSGRLKGRRPSADDMIGYDEYGLPK